MATSGREAERIRHWAAANSSPAEITLFVSNLGAGCTKSVLMSWMESQGCLEGCDYLHVPRNFQTAACFGCAFVNYVDNASAQKLVGSARDTVMTVEVSTEQGLELNIGRWIRGRVRHIRDPENLPFVGALENGDARNLIAAISQDSGPAVDKLPLPSFRPRGAGASGASSRAGGGARGDATVHGGVASRGPHANPTPYPPRFLRERLGFASLGASAVGRLAHPQAACPIAPGPGFREGACLHHVFV